MSKNIKFVQLKHLKKILPLFLLAVILFTGIRYLVFTSIVKFHKREFRQAILKQDHKNVQQITLLTEHLYKDLNGIAWKEDNKEVVINNKYHEVLSVIKQGKTSTVRIIEDHLENNLFHSFFDKSKATKELADYLLLVFALDFSLPPVSGLQERTGEFIAYEPVSYLQPNNGFYFKTIKPPQAEYFF